MAFVMLAVAACWDLEQLSDSSDLSDLRAPPAPARGMAKESVASHLNLVQETSTAKVKIWDKSFSQAQVGAARMQLDRVVNDLGRRHPELLGEAAT